MFVMRSSMQAAMKRAKKQQKQQIRAAQKAEKAKGDTKKKKVVNRPKMKIQSALGTLWDDVAMKLSELEMSTIEQTVDLKRLIRQMTRAQKDMDALTTHHLAAELVWKIGGFKRILREQVLNDGALVYSPQFASHPSGYQLMCSFCVVERDNEEYISLMVCMVRGLYDDLLPWPFCIPITFSILDQVGMDQELSGSAKPAHITKRLDTVRVNDHTKAFEKPDNAFGLSVGFRFFEKKDKVVNEPYLRNDVICIRLSLDEDDVRSFRVNDTSNDEVIDEPVMGYSKDRCTYVLTDHEPAVADIEGGDDKELVNRALFPFARKFKKVLLKPRPLERAESREESITVADVDGTSVL